MLPIYKFSDPGFDAALKKIVARGEQAPTGVEETVREIIAAVREKGDAALFDFTARFDRLELTAGTLQVTADELDQALAAIEPAAREALELAAQRIAAYHEKQLGKTWISDDESDLRLGQMVRPLDRVGIYVPGGKAAYPSSVLMNAVPARVAGVGEVIMVVPMPDGEANPYVLAAAKIARVDRIFKIGGAQAVAALAYGTASVPRPLRCRESTRLPVPAISMSPPPRSRSSARSTST